MFTYIRSRHKQCKVVWRVFCCARGKGVSANQVRCADPVAQVLIRCTMSEAANEISPAIRRGRQVTASDLHRLLRKRLTERAQTFYIEHVRKARPHTVPLQYSIDRILRILTTGMQWYHLDAVFAEVGPLTTSASKFLQGTPYLMINFTVLFRNI